MEAIRKQASKLREQVAKQQQLLLRQLGHISSETPLVDETEHQCYQQLRNLYNSTKAAKNFQRNIVPLPEVEGFISISVKQMEIVRKLADDCCKYGTENQATGYPLAKAAIQYGDSYNLMEKEKECLLSFLANEVSEPLRAQITGARSEDACHLTHQYDKLRQEVEAQAAEVLRHRTKLSDSCISAESSLKLQNAESRLKELKSAMAALGREATSAMLAVEDQQQQITFQKICRMADAERCYHQNALDILKNLYGEMIQQLEEPIFHHMEQEVNGQPPTQNSNSNGIDEQGHISRAESYFIGKAEVIFLGQLRHQNLVKLIGYCCEDEERVLVYEFMPRGSLENHLFRRLSSLPWATRLRIAIGAAKGLAFLHGAEQPVIYRDFKTSNVLLDSDFTAKLSDFGLAKIGPQGSNTHVTTRVMGTYGYAAPEYVTTGHLTTRSDVYSFGMVLLELLTGRRATDKSRPKSEQTLVDWAKPYLSSSRKLRYIVDPRFAGQYSVTGAKEMGLLALQCISLNPKDRLKMSDIVKTLESLKQHKDMAITCGHWPTQAKSSRNVTVSKVKTDNRVGNRLPSAAVQRKKKT